MVAEATWWARCLAMAAGAMLLVAIAASSWQRSKTALIQYELARPVWLMRRRPNMQRVLVPLTMLVCPADDPHCGYGGVDTSPEAYADPSPLAIIGEQCKEQNRWDCPFPGPINYGPDSPAIWLPEDDLLDDPTLVRLSLHFLTFRVSCSKSYSLSYPDLAVAPIPALTRQQVRKVWPDYPPPKASSDMGYPVMLKFVK